MSFTTGRYASGENGSITVRWEPSDPLGTYQIRVRAQDVYELWSDWSPSLTVNIRNPDLTVLAEDQYGNSLTTGDVYIDDELVGYTGSTFTVVPGTHAVFVNDFWESGGTGYRFGFDQWEDGSVDNPRNITITEDTTVTACFNKVWCPGDVDGDGDVDSDDFVTFSGAYGSVRGDPNWNSRCDFDADGDVDPDDYATFSGNYGNDYW